jgi:hypothetical protein
MSIENTNIAFENFNPSYAVINLANELQDQVCEESPSDSFTKTILKRTENMFVGEMKIVSAAGTFLSTITGVDPVGVLAEMARSVRDQIGHWRSTRFSGLVKSLS